MAMHNISEYANGQTYMVQGTESNQLIANPHFEQVESMYTEGAPEFLVDPGLYYPAATNYGYYCTGFGSPTDWEDHHKVFGVDGPDIQFTGVQSESLPYVYYTPSYGYAESPYNPYNPYIPGAMIGIDGQFAGAQQYYTVPSYQNSGSSPAYIPVLVQPDLTSPETLLNIGGPSISRSDGRNLKNNFGSPAGNYVRNSSKPSNQGNSMNREGPKDTNRQAIIYGSIPSGGIQNSTSSRAFQGRNASSSIQPVNSNYNGKVTTQRNQFKGALSDFGSDAHGWGSSEKTRSKFGFGRVQDSYTGSPDSFGQQNRGPRTNRPKNELSVKAYTTKAGNVNAEGLIVIDTEQYNVDSFPVDYEDAKFFVIKSYSEDDVHKSIKYNVWSSTPHGNKKLQSAYDDAQRIAAGKSKGCPIFLFFSVNASGQFCGVAEMIGPVDFHKDMDFWQQDKWSGSFPVKWHFIKDVQNTAFRHIILENNENKPVTNSRDTQEVMRKQGLEMLKIYKNHTLRTSLLDDFMYYESRQKMMQEERARLLVRSFHTPFSVPAAAAAAAAAVADPPRKLMNNIINSNIGSEAHRPRDNQHREVSSSLVGVNATSSSTQQRVADVVGGEKKSSSTELNEEKNDDITSGLKIGSLTINPANIIHGGDPSTGVAKPKDVVTFGSLPINVNGYDETSSGSLTVGTIALDPRVLQQPDKESSASSSSSSTTAAAATSTKTGVPKKLLMRPASAN